MKEKLRTRKITIGAALAQCPSSEGIGLLPKMQIASARVPSPIRTTSDHQELTHSRVDWRPSNVSAPLLKTKEKTPSKATKSKKDLLLGASSSVPLPRSKPCDLSSKRNYLRVV